MVQQAAQESIMIELFVMPEINANLFLFSCL